MAKRSQNPGLEAEAAQAWHAARELYAHIASGRPLVPRPSMMVLQQGEVPYAELVLHYARFFSMDVRAQQSSSFFFGSTAFVAAGLGATAIANANARARATQMSEAQWRYNVPLPVAITNRRTLTMTEGKWIQFPHDAVISFHAAPEQYALILTFGDTSPLRLSGPWAPWASLMIAVGVYGLERVPHLPVFQVFRQQPPPQVVDGQAPPQLDPPR